MRWAWVWLSAMDDPEGSPAFIARRLILQFGLIFVYLAPSIIAQHYRHPKQPMVLMVNVALGWTIVGWVVALVWAMRGRQEM